MARIPDTEIERIKSEVSLKELIESYGVQLKPHGRDWAGLCPGHHDTEPSLIVSENNLWHCLGACNDGGTVFDWVMKMEKASFRKAYEILKGKWPVKTGEPPGRDKGGSVPGKQSPADNLTLPPEADSQKLPDQTALFYHKTIDITSEATDQSLLNLVIDYYHYSLKENPEALKYLEKRTLLHPELIDHFKLGFANRTLCYRLPQGTSRAAAEMRARFQKIGMMRASGHEHFNGSLVIPVLDEQGRVQEVYGRKITERLRAGTPLHLYLPGQHKGVFNIGAFQAAKEIILCEALIDALTFWCYGFKNVTSSYGVNGFTEDHLAAFKKYQIEKILIAYDNDDAGNSAAEQLARKLSAEGFVCQRIEFPSGMDVNEFAQRSENPKIAFQQLIPGGSGLTITAPETVPMTDETSSGPASFMDSLAAPEKPCKMENGKCKETAEDKPQDQSASHLTPHTLHLTGSSIPLEIKKEELIITLGDRRWRIRGLSRNMSYEQLKVNILVSIGERFFVDTLDLYSARMRAIYLKQAAADLEIREEIIKNDLGKVLLKLEELQEQQIKKTLEPKKQEIVLPEAERQEAQRFLEDPKLLERILSDFEKCGVVGEETNKLVGYLAAVSRKLENPLAVIIQSSSAAGKTWLMETVLSFMPEEERVKYSAMTGQSLYYLGEKDLKHKILAIVEEEGAEKASYALKLLQSEGELSIASTGKDPQTGKLVTHEYKVEGPVMIFVTTTSIDIDEELQNRCLVLTVNESREQTKAIHQLQRERRTLEGLRAKKDRTSILKLHRNSQRLLRPLAVVNPYALKLTFLDDRTRTRRDHDKYLNLIEAITLLHQYQRPTKRISRDGEGPGDDYIEVTLADIETANKLAGEVLGRSLDELPPQTRQLLHIIERFVAESSQRLKIEKSDFRFSRRNVREYCNWGNTRLVKHLERLEELEYLIPHRGGRGQSFVYELLYEGNGKDGKPFMMGLLDVSKLKAKYDANLTPLKANLTPSKHPQNTPITSGKHPGLISSLVANGEPLERLSKNNSEKSHIRVSSLNQSSYRTLPAMLDLSICYALLDAKLKEFEKTSPAAVLQLHELNELSSSGRE